MRLPGRRCAMADKRRDPSEKMTFVGNSPIQFAAGAPWLPGTVYSWTCRKCHQPVAFAPATRKHWENLSAKGRPVEVICAGCFEDEWEPGTEIELAPGVIEELLAWRSRN
jgi:hypothetical protein